MDRVQQRPGGRSALVRERVLTAVREALESGEPDALSFDALAARSKVHKATIYRRWMSTSGLVTDLLTGLTPVRTPLPDTGDLSADLLAVLRRVSSTMAMPGPRMTLKLVAGSEDPALLAAASSYWSSVLDHTAEIVRRAQRRGIASTDIDPIEAIEMLLGPIYLRLLVTQQPLQDRDLERLARRAARQLEPGDVM